MCHRAQPDPEGYTETRGPEPDAPGSDLNFNPVKGCWCQWMNREYCCCEQSYSQLTRGYTPDRAVKQPPVLVIRVQCFWSGSLPHAGAESAGKQAPTLSVSFSSAAPRELLALAVRQRIRHAAVTAHVLLQEIKESKCSPELPPAHPSVAGRSSVLPRVGWSEAAIKTKQQAPFVIEIRRSCSKATHICQARKHLAAGVTCLNAPILKFDHLHKSKNRITSFHWLQVITLL